MNGLLLSNDLMFSSQATQAAAMGGVVLQVVSSVSEALAKCDAQTWDVVIVDLSTPGVDPADLTSKLALGASSRSRRIAVGPHVHRGKLDAARAADWNVFTRGQFHAGAGQILGMQDPA
jgi:DNA-binding NarL/FixJ family response regulator